jgi:hypothetical protein
MPEGVRLAGFRRLLPLVQLGAAAKSLTKDASPLARHYGLPMAATVHPGVFGQPAKLSLRPVAAPVVASAGRLYAVVVVVVLPTSVTTELLVVARFAGLAAAGARRSAGDDLVAGFAAGQVSTRSHHSVELQVHRSEQVHGKPRSRKPFRHPPSSRRSLRRGLYRSERGSYQRGQRFLHPCDYDTPGNHRPGDLCSPYRRSR